MKKFLKIMAVALAIFFALYFFGDFKINDTHVKSTLQKHVNQKTFSGVIQTIESVYKNIKKTVNSWDKSTPAKKREAKQKTKDKLLPKELQDQIKATQVKEVITSKDREQVLNIIKKNIENK